MSSTIIDDLVVRVGGEASSFDGMVGHIESGLMGLARTAGAAGSIIGAALSVPLGAAGGAMFRSFAMIDAQMTQALMNMSDQSADARKRLTNAVFDISRNSVTGPYELAHAYTMLAKTGHDAAESMDYLKRIESFAVATNGDIDKSTKNILGSMRALGMESNDYGQNLENLNYLTDLYAKASTMTLASADDLAHAMSGRLPASMKFFNVGLEESLSILTLWTQRGNSASGAGTLLDQMLRHLTDAASRHTKEWKLILGGTDILYNEQGNLRPFADSIQTLTDNLKNSNPEEARRKMEGLGLNRFIVGGVSGLYDMSDALRKIQTELKGAAGTVDRMKEMRLQDFTAQWIVLKNMVSELGYNIGADLAPAFTGLNKLLRYLVEGWNNLDPVLRKTIIYFALLVPGTVAVVTALSAVLATFFALLPVILMLSAAMGVFFGLMSAKGYTAGETFEYMKDFAKEAYANMLGFMTNFEENMSAMMKWMADNWRGLWEGMANMVSPALGNTLEIIKTFFVSLLPILMELGIAIGRAFAAGLRMAMPSMETEHEVFNAVLKAKLSGQANVDGLAEQIRGRRLQAEQKETAAALAAWQSSDFTSGITKAFGSALENIKGMKFEPLGSFPVAPFPQLNFDRGPKGLPEDLGDFDTLRRALVSGTKEGILEGMKARDALATTVTSPIDFKEINLRRFTIEGPAGLSKEGAVEEKNSAAILRTLESIRDAAAKSNEPGSSGGDFGVTITDQGGGSDF